MSWDKILVAKVVSGMGFRGFMHFNKALLWKHC